MAEGCPSRACPQGPVSSSEALSQKGFTTSRSGHQPGTPVPLEDTPDQSCHSCHQKEVSITETALLTGAQPSHGFR